MKRNEIEFETFKWIDIVEPKKDDLKNLVSEFQLEERIVLNAMDPEHLPKYEKSPNALIVFLRVVDSNKKSNGLNVQELTTKITLIVKDKHLISLHRLDQEFIKNIRANHSKQMKKNELAKMIVENSIKSFEFPIEQLEERLETFETKIFKSPKNKNLLREAFNIKRKLHSYKKVLKFYVETFHYVESHPEYEWPNVIGLKEYTDRLNYYIDEAIENISGLMNLYLSIAAFKTNEASYKTNEIMKVLTVFSLFFLPLNFLAGIYGMNFENMPELRHPNGYAIVLVLMGLISVGIFIWVYRKGWIHEVEEQTINPVTNETEK